MKKKDDEIIQIITIEMQLDQRRRIAEQWEKRHGVDWCQCETRGIVFDTNPGICGQCRKRIDPRAAPPPVEDFILRGRR